MKSTLPAFCLFILITALSLKGLGQGVTTPSFGPSAVTESFENIAISDSNYVTGATNGSRTVPVTPFTFSSGIRLTEPDPNAPFVVEIEDANKGFVAFYTCPTQVSEADIPDGKAYLDKWNSTTMTFTFPVLAEKVGMYIEGSTCTSSNTITLTAYNAANEVIGTFTTEATGSASNWKDHFIGFNSTTDGIAKITLTGPPIVIDKLTFEKQQECLTTPSFGPSAVTESFEGIPTSANNPLYDPSVSGYGNTQPVIPFTFGTGITLTTPNPNTGQVLIGDWSKGISSRYLCDQAVVSEADIPDGTAFLSVMNTTSVLTFTLPALSRRVGLYVEGPGGNCISSTTITLTAYNASNAVIGSCTTEATNDGSNWKNHFLGLRSLGDGIAKITLSGPYIMVDKLTFEPFPCVQKTWYLDADNDGYYTGSGVLSCTVPGTGYKSTGLIAGGDCDDANAKINPATIWYLDADGDDHYTGTGITQCASPGAGYKYDGQFVANDCNDADASVWQSNVLYMDQDGDGYDAGNTIECYGATIPQGFSSTTLGSDCDDTNAQINPTTIWYLDADNDGYFTGAGVTSCTLPGIGYKYMGLSSGGDCNDGNADVHPGAVEICGNGIDDNCDGNIDEGCIVPYTLSIADASMNEGSKGKSNMIFTVTLNKPFTKKITIQYTTHNGTATAGSDYTAKSGTLTFKPNSTKQTVAIPIIGDKTVEPNETFTVVLSNPVNAVLLKGTATGTILNDDGTTTPLSTSSKSMEMIALERAVSVAPNPATSTVYVTLQGYAGKVQLQLLDVRGRLLKQVELQMVPSSSTRQQLNVSNLTGGIYFLTAVDENGSRQTQKLVIAR